jgi:hypothetical protein
VDPRRSGSCPTRAWAAMGEASTTGRMVACRGPDRGASPPQRVRSRPAMASVEKGMGERGVNDGLHLTTMNTSGSRDDDTWSFGGRHDASFGRIGEGRPRHRCAGQQAVPGRRAQASCRPPRRRSASGLQSRDGARATAAASWHKGRGVGVEVGREEGWGVGSPVSSTWAPKGGRAVVPMGKKNSGLGAPDKRARRLGAAGALWGTDIPRVHWKAKRPREWPAGPIIRKVIPSWAWGGTPVKED